MTKAECLCNKLQETLQLLLTQNNYFNFDLFSILIKWSQILFLGTPT